MKIVKKWNLDKYNFSQRNTYLFKTKNNEIFLIIGQLSNPIKVFKYQNNDLEIVLELYDNENIQFTDNHIFVSKDIENSNNKLTISVEKYDFNGNLLEKTMLNKKFEKIGGYNLFGIKHESNYIRLLCENQFFYIENNNYKCCDMEGRELWSLPRTFHKKSTNLYYEDGYYRLEDDHDPLIPLIDICEQNDMSHIKEIDKALKKYESKYFEEITNLDNGMILIKYDIISKYFNIPISEYRKRAGSLYVETDEDSDTICVYCEKSSFALITKDGIYKDFHDEIQIDPRYNISCLTYDEFGSVTMIVTPAISTVDEHFEERFYHSYKFNSDLSYTLETKIPIKKVDNFLEYSEQFMQDRYHKIYAPHNPFYKFPMGPSNIFSNHNNNYYMLYEQDARLEAYYIGGISKYVDSKKEWEHVKIFINRARIPTTYVHSFSTGYILCLSFGFNLKYNLIYDFNDRDRKSVV